MNIIIILPIQKYQSDHKMLEKYTDPVNNN